MQIILFQIRIQKLIVLFIHPKPITNIVICYQCKKIELINLNVLAIICWLNHFLCVMMILVEKAVRLLKIDQLEKLLGKGASLFVPLTFKYFPIHSPQNWRVKIIAY